MWQVRDDAVIDNPTDAQSTFDALGSNDKELHWIEARPSDSKMATTVGPHPEKALAFFDEHMN
jgi:hypothetical protein